MDRLTATCSTCDVDGICTGGCVARSQMGVITFDNLITLAFVVAIALLFIPFFELSSSAVLSVTQTDILELTLGSMAGFALVHVLSKFKIVRK